VAGNKRKFSNLCENGVANEGVRSKRTCLQSVRVDGELHRQMPVHGDPLATDAIDSPAVWAKRCHGYCETLPNLAQYNGSVYWYSKIPKGFYIDREARTRDYLGERVIVTTL